MQIRLFYNLPERSLTTNKIKLRKILMIDLKIFVYYVDQYNYGCDINSLHFLNSNVYSHCLVIIYCVDKK